MRNKILILMITAILLVTSCIAAEATEILAFSDVPEGYWAYETIMEMTEAGLFKGTTEPVNGVGTFSPTRKMTRAEFITVALRAVYPNEASRIETKGKKWWSGFYKLALDKGILNSSELDFGNLDEAMSREEMAMIMVRCVEKNGEELTHRVSTSKIADYDTIGDAFKDYILDCYSYGLLCGVDSKGTFAPTRTLKREDAATVLCRLINKEMRVEVELDEDQPDEHEDPIEDKDENDDLLPWEKPGAKQPENYSWADYEKLTTLERIAFQEYLGANGFDKWLNRVWAAQGDNTETPEVNPWEKPGGKHPEDYTWEEYVALTSSQKIAFKDYLGDRGFETWIESVRASQPDEPEEPEGNPWEEPGAKQPQDYTWEEFEALSGAQQIEFQNFLGTEEFNKWYDRFHGNDYIYLPWENGGKDPNDYLWSEFEKLSPAQQIAFQNYLGSAKFEKWFMRVRGEESVYLPWEFGGKDPFEYEYEEFEALNEAQQIAFQTYLGKTKFEEWLNREEPIVEEEVELPWENGGKDPAEYSYQEFEALNEAQQMAFQSYLGDEFDNWLERAKAEAEDGIYLPWEDGGKDPFEYSYDEYEDLNRAQQMAFQEYLGEERFEEWINLVKPDRSEEDEGLYFPWEHGGKDPREYTWEEFCDLSMGQQMAFQEYLGEIEFEKWLNENEP